MAKVIFFEGSAANIFFENIEVLVRYVVLPENNVTDCEISVVIHNTEQTASLFPTEHIPFSNDFDHSFRLADQPPDRSWLKCLGWICILSLSWIEVNLNEEGSATVDRDNHSNMFCGECNEGPPSR